MLCQNHEKIIKGFMGQTTAFDQNLVKSNVLIMGSCELNGEARYIHGEKGKGMYTFFGGHDPEDYQHAVGDPPTDLSLYKNSPGYRLILNNILFPAATKKKQMTTRRTVCIVLISHLQTQSKNRESGRSMQRSVGRRV